MALGFRIRLQGSMFYLSGVFDETADFRPLLAAPRPLRLNLSGISAANSLGTRLYIKFIQDLGDGALEIHDCSPSVVDILNSFPSTLGKPHRPERVRSILVPYYCGLCEQGFSMQLGAADFKQHQGEFPKKICQRCAEILTCEFSPEEMLLFLDCPD